MAVLAKQIDKPFVGWDQSRSDNDRGQIPVQHRRAVDLRHRFESVEPGVQLLEAYHPFSEWPRRRWPVIRRQRARSGGLGAAFHAHGNSSCSALTFVQTETMRSSRLAR